ncbi:MAG: bepD [Alphaproteobacteria bacterium]|nr:bepD [Alphaproteobacteria bacterium]
MSLRPESGERLSSQPPRRFPFVPVLLALIIIGGGSYAAYKKFGPHAAPPPPAMPTPMVTVQEIARRDVPLSFEYSGRTAGSREVEIRARVSGILQKRAYIEGQAVKQGDVLFEIDPATTRVAQNQAEARFKQAENDWNRAASLFKEKALSARERDEAQANFASAKAELENARINQGYTTVIAPISGITSKETLSEGSLVTADTSLLTRISQLDPIYVNFSVPDSDVFNQRRLIAEGKIVTPEDGKLKAEIHFGDGSVYPQQGDLNFTDATINEQTGTVSARATVPNPNQILMPGQFVRVVVRGLVKKDVIAIPDKAVMQGPQGTFVYTVSPESKVAVTPVTLGEIVNEARVIESGLKPGDKVIINDMIKLRPDTPVTIAAPEAGKAPDAPPAAAAETETPPSKDTQADIETDKE